MNFGAVSVTTAPKVVVKNLLIATKKARGIVALRPEIAFEVTVMRLLMRQLTAAFPLGCIVSAALSGSAYAHVKWFCAFDVAGQPRNLANVLCPDLEFLVGLTILFLLGGALTEGTRLGMAMERSMDRVTGLIRDNTEWMYRAGAAFFF